MARYVYDPEAPNAEGGKGAVVRVDADWVGQRTRGGLTSEGEIYDGARAVDGADISSRKKRREYMAATGTTDPSDFKGAQERFRKERENLVAAAQGKNTPYDDRSRREAIGRSLHELRNRRKP